jgi:multimeric flavodoxin WrbA
MKVIGVNGSPRKGWNTHLLVEKALAGAQSAGAETELVHLYDLHFQGCISCFACKKREGSGAGHCAVRDELSPLLERIATADALILASPIYLSEVTASMRALLERLAFQYLTYSQEPATFFTRHLPTAFIYTMNVPEAALEKIGYNARFQANKGLLERVLRAPSQFLTVTETWQTKDYSRYHMSMFDEAERQKRRQEVFPQDCEKARALGISLAAAQTE